ncbi:DUF1289 domain-containing protein [Aureimonas sp. AU4]|uniref:DUF1289 domain-containing protein n=1 Tax=Aureimonas sp. AU4 TaxID=1638163 RepID=UPI0009EBBBC3|nr:DUF1289 domain-containing protein [Aureimonas sp. AU4]
MTVPSPCRRECRLSADRTICLSCRRTLAEIMHWATMTEPEQRAVLARLARLPNA